MQSIEITGVDFGSNSYDIYLCDITLTYCFLISSSTSIPPSFYFTLPVTFPNPFPPPATTLTFGETDSLIIKLIDTVTGCEKFIPYYCNNDVCFEFFIFLELFELYWKCVIPSSGNFNDKPYYVLLFNDCTTPLSLGNILWWNISSNRWEITDTLGGGTVVLYNENPDNYPLTTNEYPWVQLITNTFNIASSKKGACVTTEMCFTLVTEATDEYSCVINPISYFNGKPYYYLLSPDCTTPFFDSPNYYIVWWNISSNRWEITLSQDVSNAGSGTLLYYNENPSNFPETNGTYTWNQVVLVPDIEILDSILGECPIPSCPLTYVGYSFYTIDSGFLQYDFIITGSTTASPCISYLNCPLATVSYSINSGPTIVTTANLGSQGNPPPYIFECSSARIETIVDVNSYPGQTISIFYSITYPSNPPLLITQTIVHAIP